MSRGEWEQSDTAGSRFQRASVQNGWPRGHKPERRQGNNHARSGPEGSFRKLCETRAWPFRKAEGKEDDAFGSCESCRTRGLHDLATLPPIKITSQEKPKTSERRLSCFT